MENPEYTRVLESLDRDAISLVGGKAANLGELSKLDVPALPGFATTATAYDRYIEANELEQPIVELLAGLDADDTVLLRGRGNQLRELVRSGSVPDDLRQGIVTGYRRMATTLNVAEPSVAVRSSATAEDLPEASFAGQQETVLNVQGSDELIEAVKRCYASLFTDRAIAYRAQHGFDHLAVKLSCVVQLMGRADLGAAGVLFTIDPDTGFENVVVVEAAYGLGDLVVRGEVTPDSFVAFKPTNGIIERRLGEKDQRMVYSNGGTAVESVPAADRNRYALTDAQVQELVTYGKRIEDHYERPMDVEWLLDGEREELFVVQARPETVHAPIDEHVVRTYRLQESGEVLVEGTAVGEQIGSGTVRIIDDLLEMDRFEAGDVLVTPLTDPDWVPIMRRAAAIVTERGGKTSHAAIVSRELGVPTIVGTGDATKRLRDGEVVTVDCTSATGRVYRGALEFDVEEVSISETPETDTEVMLNLGDPSQAFSLADLPMDGVGLVREEFIVTTQVGKHPLYLLERGEAERFIEALRTGIARIAAAFHPDDVVVRLSDFKTDEYRNLEGGRRFEPVEANPMLGWRGASRYYDESFREAFRMECEALRQVREDVGLDNVVVMVPFCRTPEEGERVLELMDEFGLEQDTLDVYVMVELPSNVVLADQFAERFDGFSIGSNDLTQLVLGVDRGSEKLAYLFDEANEAVTRSIRSTIREAHRYDCHVGICGDAPSTIPQYVEFLVDAGIDAISVSPNVAIETILRVEEAESGDD